MLAQIDSGPRTIASALRELRSGELTATRLLEEVEAVADTAADELGVYIHRYRDEAGAVAARIDADRAAERPLGPLAGIPLGIKDVIATQDAPTTAQSRAQLERVFDGCDAPVVQRLRRAGAVLTGKTSTMEFAIGYPGPDAGFPMPRNPWDTHRWRGGSSSGTAIGVATGMFLGGPGTDTAGSIRNPSAWCGITGLKPTYDRVPRAGVVPLSFTFDHVGPMARTAEDCALLLTTMAAATEREPRGTGATMPSFDRASLDGRPVGYSHLGLDGPGANHDIAALFEQALQDLAGLGADLREVRLPHYEAAHAATMIGLSAEAFAFHRHRLAERWTDYGPAARLAIAHGALVAASDYVQVQRVRSAVLGALRTLFSDVDLIVTPTTTMPAPRADDFDFDAVVRSLCSPYWNASGCPTLSVPVGRTPEGLPAGMQISGPPDADHRVLAAGMAYQARTDHHLQRPPTVGGH